MRSVAVIRGGVCDLTWAVPPPQNTITHHRRGRNQGTDKLRRSRCNLVPYDAEPAAAVAA